MGETKEDLSKMRSLATGMLQIRGMRRSDLRSERGQEEGRRIREEEAEEEYLRVWREGAGRSSRRGKGSRRRSGRGLRRGASREGGRLYNQRCRAPSTRGRPSLGQGSPPPTTPSRPPLTTNLDFSLGFSLLGFRFAVNWDGEVAVMSELSATNGSAAGSRSHALLSGGFRSFLFSFRRHSGKREKSGGWTCRFKRACWILSSWVESDLSPLACNDWERPIIVFYLRIIYISTVRFNIHTSKFDNIVIISIKKKLCHYCLHRIRCSLTCLLFGYDFNIRGHIFLDKYNENYK